MKLAIEEHLQCSETPRVGAVVAKDGVLLSSGRRGERPRVHAERVALEKLDPSDRVGTTVYTTLEPCVQVHHDQELQSCSDLIIESGVREVVVGVLDPNGTIYSQGYRKLLENNVSVGFFNRGLREAIEEQTFEFGTIDRIYASGKRRVPVVHGGIEIEVQFSRTDERTIQISWQTLQPSHGCVDLHSVNGAVRVAAGARRFGDITDSGVFCFPSHFARLKRGDIAVVQPAAATFVVLIQLMELFENDILFKWEVRNTNGR